MLFSAVEKQPRDIAQDNANKYQNELYEASNSELESGDVASAYNPGGQSTTPTKQTNTKTNATVCQRHRTRLIVTHPPYLILSMFFVHERLFSTTISMPFYNYVSENNEVAPPMKPIDSFVSLCLLTVL